MVTATQLLHRLTSLEPYDPDREWDPPVDDPRVLQNLRANDLDRLPWFYKQYTERLPRVTLPRELPATIAAAVDVLAGTADVPHADLSLAHLSRLLHLCGDTFAAALNQAAAAHLRGPVTKLTPHVLRHACASRLCGEGIGPTAIQQLLGHRWLSTTVRYVHVANEAIESAYQQAAERAAARVKEQRHAMEPAAGRRPAGHLAVLRPAAAAGRRGPGDLGREDVASVVGAAGIPDHNVGQPDVLPGVALH